MTFVGGPSARQVKHGSLTELFVAVHPVKPQQTAEADAVTLTHSPKCLTRAYLVVLLLGTGALLCCKVVFTGNKTLSFREIVVAKKLRHRYASTFSQCRCRFSLSRCYNGYTVDTLDALRFRCATGSRSGRCC